MSWSYDKYNYLCLVKNFELNPKWWNWAISLLGNYSKKPAETISRCSSARTSNINNYLHLSFAGRGQSPWPKNMQGLFFQLRKRVQEQWQIQWRTLESHYNAVIIVNFIRNLPPCTNGTLTPSVTSRKQEIPIYSRPSLPSDVGKHKNQS